MSIKKIKSSGEFYPVRLKKCAAPNLEQFVPIARIVRDSAHARRPRTSGVGGQPPKPPQDPPQKFHRGSFRTFLAAMTLGIGGTVALVGGIIFASSLYADNKQENRPKTLESKFAPLKKTSIDSNEPRETAGERRAETDEENAVPEPSDFLEPIHPSPKVVMEDSVESPPSQAPVPLNKESVVDRPSIAFTEVQAQDGTFTLKVPSNWKIQKLDMEGLSVTSPSNELVYCVMATVPVNVSSRASTIAASLRLEQPILREAIAFSGSISPPLSPKDVMGKLFPRALPDIFRNMQILDVEKVPSTFNEAFVHYKYYDPNRKTSFEGRTNVKVMPSIRLGVATEWAFSSFGYQSPEKLYDKNVGIYRQIVDSYQEDKGAKNRRIIERTLRMQMTALAVQAQVAANQRAAQQIMNSGMRLFESGNALGPSHGAVLAQPSNRAVIGR